MPPELTEQTTPDSVCFYFFVITCSCLISLSGTDEERRADHFLFFFSTLSVMPWHNPSLTGRPLVILLACFVLTRVRRQVSLCSDDEAKKVAGYSLS